MYNACKNDIAITQNKNSIKMNRKKQKESLFMNVIYVRQISENSSLEYLNGPYELARLSPETSHYKNIVFLTNPDEKEMELYVRSVGYEVSEPQKSLVERSYPLGSIIHYVVGGEGPFNGKPIKSGDCAVAFHDRPHSLATDPENPLKFYWIIIRHTPSFDLERFGFDRNNEVFSYDFEDKIKKIFDEMLYAPFSEQDAYCHFISKAYEILSWHRYGFMGGDKKSVPDESAKRAVLAKRMWEQTEYSISVEDMAKKMGLSRMHFSQIFKQETGMLPRAYILQHKMSIAKLRIDSGERRYRQLAFQLGYKDYNSFYRAFKSIMGVGPEEYVKREWEKEEN